MADYPYNTARWQRLRKRHLAMFPLCEGCEQAGRLTPANTVDHRVPISAGGATFPAHDGLASLCPSCHSIKTARGVEAGAVRTSRPVQPRKGCDANGMPLDRSHPWAQHKQHARTPVLPADNRMRGSGTATRVADPCGVGHAARDRLGLDGSERMVGDSSRAEEKSLRAGLRKTAVPPVFSISFDGDDHG